MTPTPLSEDLSKLREQISELIEWLERTRDERHFPSHLFGWCEEADDRLKALLDALERSQPEGVRADVESLSKVYADAAGYYVEFHRGLSSPSADAIRKGVAAVVAALSSRPDRTEKRKRASLLLKAVERFIREEAAHARRIRAEERTAGHPLTSGQLVTTTRDGVDLAHADLVGSFTTRDCQDARRLLSAPARPEVSSEGVRDGWQPIETAPKDGTDIMLGAPAQMFQGKPAEPRVTVGHWTSEEECRRQIGDCGGECRCPEYEHEEPSWISWDGGFTEENPPTHWRPLDAPPALSSGNGLGGSTDE